MPAKNATPAPTSVSFEAALQKSSKRFGVFNEPQEDENDFNPKGIVYLPKQLWEELGRPKAITVTATVSK